MSAGILEPLLPLSKRARGLYEPLSVELKSIRILHVQSAPRLSQDRRISGKLNTIHLTAELIPSFAALSYVWGDTSTPQIISVDNHQINVSSSCYAALKQLRKRFGTFDIWIDAVCINQEDELEKVTQIPLMEEIYSKADPTYVWLGKDDSSSRRAIDYLRTAGFQEWLPSPGHLTDAPLSSFQAWRAALHCNLARVRWTSSEQNYHDLKQIPDRYVSSKRFRIKATVDDLRLFFSRPWFHRVWCFQEILLANKAILCCGDQLLPWPCVIRSMLYANSCEPNDSFYDINQSEPNPWTSKTTEWTTLTNLWLFLRKQPPPTSTLLQDGQDPLVLAYLESLDKILGRISTLAPYFPVCFAIFCLSILVIGILVFVFFISYYLDAHIEVLAWMFFSFIFVWLMTVGGAGKCTDFNGSRVLRKPLQETPVQELLIQEIRLRHTTNPKDKLFGIHSILGRLGLKLGRPDYSLSTPFVQKQLFIQLLEWTSSLNLLLCATGRHDDASIPSWVPDWATDARDSWLHDKYLFSRAIKHATTSSKLPSITAHDQWRFLGSDKILVQGRRVGSIGWRTSQFTVPTPATAPPLHNIDKACALLRRMSDKTSFAPGDGDSPIAFASPLEGHWEVQCFQYKAMARNARGRVMSIGGHVLKTTKIDWETVWVSPNNRIRTRHDPKSDRWKIALYEKLPRKSDDFTHQVVSMVMGRGYSAAGELVDRPTSDAQLDVILANDGDHASEISISEWSTNMIKGRRMLFMTDKGAAGNGPDGAKEGDNIVLISGVTLPLILRPCVGQDGREFRLVGFAHVEGMMEGEMWDDEALQEIVLC